jgi:hypothetical protein
MPLEGKSGYKSSLPSPPHHHQWKGNYDHFNLPKAQQYSLGAVASLPLSKQQASLPILSPSMTQQVFIFSSIPLLFIIFISIFHILVDHAPYLNGKCRGPHCVAGSGEQFVWWTLLILIFLYFISRVMFSCSWHVQKLSDFDGKRHIIQSGVLNHLDEASDFGVS